MNQFSDAQYMFLRLLAECGRVSHPMLELTGYSYTYRTRCLKALLDQQYIRKQGKGRSKSYALAAKGRDHLAGFNAGRFRGEVMAQTRQLARHPERAALRGDAAAMLSLAGFAVHADDKPALPSYTPPLPNSPSTGDWKRLYQNACPISYPGEADVAAYLRRLTSVGCYYDATGIKELAGAGGDIAGVGYSRACGVLMTPSCLLRVYHSRDVAMKFHVTGERNFHDLLLTAKVFRGYLPKQDNAALIFGSGFTAAQHILSSRLNGQTARMPVYTKRKGGKGYKALAGTAGEMLTPTNLGNPAFFLPLSADSRPLLRLMRYPFWQEEMVRRINREVFRLENHARWQFELDGRTVYILAALDLAQIDLALRSIKSSAGKKVWIICLDWQEPLFRQLLGSFPHSCEIRLTRLPAAYMDDLLAAFERFWEG